VSTGRKPRPIGHGERAHPRLPADNQALRLHKSHVGVLNDEQVLSIADVHLAVDDHLHDLIVLALGATRDASAPAKYRGVRVGWPPAISIMRCGATLSYIRAAACRDHLA